MANVKRRMLVFAGCFCVTSAIAVDVNATHEVYDGVVDQPLDEGFLVKPKDYAKLRDVYRDLLLSEDTKERAESELKRMFFPQKLEALAREKAGHHGEYIVEGNEMKNDLEIQGFPWQYYALEIGADEYSRQGDCCCSVY
ncbi:MAG: hypothetical protein LBF72_00820 [Holosporales bacterium]|jgi:hypothetical protein|nr:hypothetical protein [Holosporales bacterium]